MKFDHICRPAACCSIKPHSQISSSHYQLHQIQATDLILKQEADEKKWKNVQILGLAAWCSSTPYTHYDYLKTIPLI